MKKVILFVFLLTSSLSGFSAPTGEVTRQHANELTRKLTDQLGLDEGRYLQMRRLVYEHLVQAADIDTQYADDNAVRAQKQQTLQAEFAAQLKTVLTEAQYTRYTNLAINLLADASARP
ncbi:hypothetical protein [Hymenobacter sp. BT730]|uniref:hypothetical protein n=1 Tax=Hymenobacter sp. BT730 TaxID=3063332 RepID=UPI0026DFBBDE|nr:hypothetical protein [Hymenobacter sp. BT730]